MIARRTNQNEEDDGFWEDVCARRGSGGGVCRGGCRAAWGSEKEMRRSFDKIRRQAK